jgi:hypothetical protein
MRTCSNVFEEREFIFPQWEGDQGIQVKPKGRRHDDFGFSTLDFWEGPMEEEVKINRIPISRHEEYGQSMLIFRPLTVVYANL